VLRAEARALDAIADQGRQNQVRCRCGILLGYLTGRRPRWILREPQVPAVVQLRLRRIDLVCPACGNSRTFLDDAIEGLILKPEPNAVHSG